MAFVLEYDDPLVTALVQYVAGEEFQGIFERFFLSHALEFTDAEEHDLRYHGLYLQFQEMFEAKLDEFAQEHDLTGGEFAERLKQAQTKDAKAAHYINILLASAEYATFVALMRMMRRVVEARQQEGHRERQISKDIEPDAKTQDYDAKDQSRERFQRTSPTSGRARHDAHHAAAEAKCSFDDQGEYEDMDDYKSHKK